MKKHLAVMEQELAVASQKAESVSIDIQHWMHRSVSSINRVGISYVSNEWVFLNASSNSTHVNSAIHLNFQALIQA